MDRWSFGPMLMPVTPGQIDETIITEEIAVGGVDRGKREIKRIFWSTRKFQIYEADNEIRYNLPDDYDTAAKLRTNVFGLIESRANVERLRRAEGVSLNDCGRAGADIAGALASAFEAEPETESAKLPLLMLQRTEARLLSLIKSQFRKRYLFGAAAAFLLVVAILIVLMAVVAEEERNIGHLHLERIATFAGYCAFGALGALFSVAWRIESLDFRTDIGRWEYFVAGLARIGIGVVAGIVVGLALQSKFIVLNFGPPSGTDVTVPAQVVYYLIAFIAGFSESLVPNILARGEENATSSMAEAKQAPAPPAANG